MKVEGWLFLGCGIFLAGGDLAYWFTSHEPTGTAALALAVGLCLFIGIYLLVSRRGKPMRPEDDNEGEIIQGTGELGFFSPHSWWPFWVALAAAVVSVGAAVGWWLVLIGVVSLIFAAIGFVFEYYRGFFSH